MASEYQYRPLEDPTTDLRLVKIINGWETDNIRCTIATSQELLPSYQALSYVWGSSNIEKVPILLNGQRFFVTVNLASALRNLRFNSKIDGMTSWGGYYWIDALCINQGDLGERDQQVQRMKEIYRHATRVIIYLGDHEEPGDEPLRSGFKHRGIDMPQPKTSSSTQYLPDLIRILANILDASLSHLPHHRELGPDFSRFSIDNWAELATIFHRPWFERLWVIQELGVARYAVVQWGRTVEPWQKIEQAAACILRPPAGNLMPDYVRRILPLMGAHRLTQVALNSVRDIDSENILTALWHTRGARCSDPRDRLYAILGVVGDVQDIKIDYASSVEEVYRNWTINRIKRTRNLDILSACANSGRNGTFPSWVPDLRLPWGEDKHLWNWTHYLGPKEPYKPSWEMEGKLEESRFILSQSAVSLTVDGQYVSRITALSDVGDVTTNLMDPTSLTPRLYHIIVGWETWVRENCSSDAWGIAQLEYFQNALLRGGVSNGSNHSLKSRYLSWRSINYHIEGGGRRVRVNKNDKEKVSDLDGQLFSMVHGSQVFLTAHDRVGIVSGNCEARIGDQIWMLVGGLTPFILREIEGGYRMITPCYFHNHLMKHIAGTAGPLKKVTLL